MSGGIRFEVHASLYEEIGRHLQDGGLGKDAMSAAFKGVMGRLGTKGKQELKRVTEKHTGSLAASANKKHDRTPDREVVWLVVGYMKKPSGGGSPNKQFWYVFGTKSRYTQEPRQYKGEMPPAEPEPIGAAYQAMSRAAPSILAQHGKNYVLKEFTKVGNKYGRKLKKLL